MTSRISDALTDHRRRQVLFLLGAQKSGRIIATLHNLTPKGSVLEGKSPKISGKWVFPKIGVPPNHPF